MTIRVLICDKLPVVRDGMRTLLDAVPDIEVVATTDNGMEAIVLVRTEQPDVVVTDLQLQTISGLEMIRRLNKEYVRLNVVVFSSSDSDATVDEVLHAGVRCLLGKDANSQDVIATIQAAAAGQTVLAPAIAQRLVDWYCEQLDIQESLTYPEVKGLTQRERDVTLMVARGMSTEEVARTLTIGVATVRTHLYRVRTKLGVRDRAELVSLAYRSGLVKTAGRIRGE